MIQSSTVQTPTRRASLPASLAQELGPQSCFQERRTLAPAWWGLPLCTWPQSVCHTCCSSHPEPVTEDTQVSLFRFKVQICITLACSAFTWMLIEAYQMDALLLKTWNHSAYNNVYLCPFELKPCWVLFLQYCLHLRERHYWGYFSGQHIWESKREIQSEMDIDIILDCDTFNPYLNSSTSFSLRPERYSRWCIQFVEAAL